MAERSRACALEFFGLNFSVRGLVSPARLEDGVLALSDSSRGDAQVELSRQRGSL